ncbi:MAG: hypothetical protein M4D80_24480 [Myxococcota bacterium]|nr:hypothetical protein [Deltaproteobacteria bacterium]MDQ3338335.1 hypothetical protein [Myxococcota bacterium]
MQRDDTTRFLIGSRVSHAKFGKGDIVGRQGLGDAMKLEIRFEDGATRLLAVAFVKPL